MERLRVEGESGRGLFEFVGPVPHPTERFEDSGFGFAMTSDGLSVECDVYDVETRRWSDFFQELARDWRGWDGEKTVESIENQLRLVATMDRTGHVTLRAHVRSDLHEGPGWRAEACVMVEAGQLDLLASRAAQFFG